MQRYSLNSDHGSTVSRRSARSSWLSTALLTSSLLLGGLLLPSLGLAQRITDINPGVNSTNVTAETSISGLFDTSDGSRVDVSSVKLLLDGTNVTAASSITPNFFRYKPPTPLSPGTHTVQVEYKNSAGLQRVASWTFTVQAAQAALAISSVTHNASAPLGPGSTLLATLSGTPAAQASILLIEGWTNVREIQAQEVSPGTYVASFVMPNPLTPQEAVIMGQLQKGGQKIYGAASQPIVLRATAVAPEVVASSPATTAIAATEPTPAVVPLKPQFTSHQMDQRVASESGFQLVGQTRPNATVQVKVVAITPVLGGFVNVGGTSLVDRQFVADASGLFTVPVPAPLVINSNTRYDIQATATANGEVSSVTQLRLRQ